MQRAPSLVVLLTGAVTLSVGCSAVVIAQQQWPSKAPTEEQVEAAKAQAVRFLVGYQEKYQRDSGYRGRGGPDSGRIQGHHTYLCTG